MQSLPVSLILASLTLLFGATGGEAEPLRGGRTMPGGPVRAVLELFTSQGCSSCPPADALLRRFASEPGVLALSLPVDYWDYIGWKDTFGSPAHSERQRSYARAFGSRSVYTPQVVVNGTAEAPAYDRAAIDRAIAATSKEASRLHIPVSLEIKDGNLIVDAGPGTHGGDAGEATVWLVTFTPSADVVIERGENRGRTLSYTNIVRSLSPIGRCNGQAFRLEVEMPASLTEGADSAAVLIQENGLGPIAGAAVLRR